MELHNVWGEPTEFKGINIYPCKMQDYEKFQDTVTCLMIPKHKIADKRVLKMSYLQFILEISEENPNIMNYLIKLLDLVSDDLSFLISPDNIPYLYSFKYEMEINENEFEDLRKLILSQNLVKFDTELIDPELERTLREAKEFMNRKNKPPTLEEMIISYHVGSGVDYTTIKIYSIYQFHKSLEKLGLLKDWEIYTYPALKGGGADKITHWLSHVPERGEFDDVTMSMAEFNQMASNNGISNI